MRIKGEALTDTQRRQVLAAYVHRHLAIGPERAYASDDAWLIDHAFYFVKDGSRLSAKHRHCEPHYIADSAHRV